MKEICSKATSFINHYRDRSHIKAFMCLLFGCYIYLVSVNDILHGDDYLPYIWTVFVGTPITPTVLTGSYEQWPPWTMLPVPGQCKYGLVQCIIVL